ncbi:MAG: macro domain-containing protein [Gemmatimonadota bacterium]|nr:macro domain-containing protein [Gemmatimonadota bacterium]
MIEIVQGELSDQDTDAVLRPIRSDLAPVTAAARDVGQRAGAAVEDRLEATGRVPVGGAVLTPGGGLVASFLIHAVVMSMEEPQSRATVERALGNGLARARDWGVTSLSLPALGLGAGSMNPEESARAFLDVLQGHLETGEPPRELRVVAINEFERDLLARMLG